MNIIQKKYDIFDDSDDSDNNYEKNQFIELLNKKRERDSQLNRKKAKPEDGKKNNKRVTFKITLNEIKGKH